jgi:hypothetical protein
VELIPEHSFDRVGIEIRKRKDRPALTRTANRGRLTLGIFENMLLRSEDCDVIEKAEEVKK